MIFKLLRALLSSGPSAAKPGLPGIPHPRLHRKNGQACCGAYSFVGEYPAHRCQVDECHNKKYLNQEKNKCPVI